MLVSFAILLTEHHWIKFFSWQIPGFIITKLNAASYQSENQTDTNLAAFNALNLKSYLGLKKIIERQHYTEKILNDTLEGRLT